MSDDHILKITEQVGELNGTVKAMAETIEKFVERSEVMHRDHYVSGAENKVNIEKINARHATYWKIIGAFGGLGGVLTWLKTGGGS